MQYTVRILLFSLLQIINGHINYNHFEYGARIIPHPDKIAKGGEDAYYANEQLLVVADGVGGWNEKGIDPSLFSKELCQNIENNWLLNKNIYIEDLKQLAIDSVGQCKSIGTSTLVMVQIDQNIPEITTSNLGDSGYIILRFEQNGELKLVFESEEQQHGFNFPFQAGTEGDDPSLSIVKSHEVQNGDIIVVGSDGLFDNLDGLQIRDYIRQFKFKYGDIDLKKAAITLSERAKIFSLNKAYMSPFAKQAIKSGFIFKGGKSDDITVIIARVKLIDYSQKGDTGQSQKIDL